MDFLQYKNYKIRTIFYDSQLRFIVSDICEILGIKDTRGAVRSVEKEYICLLPIMNKKEIVKRVLTVNTIGAFKIIFGSRKLASKDFIEWFFSSIFNYSENRNIEDVVYAAISPYMVETIAMKSSLERKLEKISNDLTILSGSIFSSGKTKDIF